MKAIAAVVASLAIFLFAWFFIAAIILGLAYLAAGSGIGGGMFWLVNIILTSVLSPFAAAAIAMYAAITTFKNTESSTIFVAFVSICAFLITILFIFGAVAAVVNKESGDLLWFVAQSVAIFVGACIGRSMAFNSNGYEQ